MGDPVYYRKHFRQGKVDTRWKPYYRIVEQTGPVTFIIWDQLSGKVKRAHANDLKLAELRSWETSIIENSGRPIRQSTLAAPPLNKEYDLEDSESELPPIKFAKIHHHSEENPCPSERLEGVGYRRHHPSSRTEVTRWATYADRRRWGEYSLE